MTQATDSTCRGCTAKTAAMTEFDGHLPGSMSCVAGIDHR